MPGYNHLTSMIKKSKSWLMGRLVCYLVLSAITIVVFIPILITAFASFKTPEQIGSDFPLMPPTSIYLKNFSKVFTTGNIFMGFKNSMILALASVSLNALLGSMTAYCLSRFNFKLKKPIIGLFLLGMIIPTYVTEIARFSVVRNLGLYNTIFAPLIIYAATDLMQIYIFLQFLGKIPTTLDESAMLDGCSYFKIFWKIIFPLLLPATATLAIIKAVEVINDMYIPYLYMPGSSLRTLTTTLMYFSNSMFSAWQYLSAAIMVVMVPTLIIYLMFQRYIFAGIVAGAIKE